MTCATSSRSARPNYQHAVEASGVLEALAAFDPHVVGTPPLGLDLPGSDIDIVCCARDAHAFSSCIWGAFAKRQCFTLRQWTGGERAVIAGFEAEGWAFELFGCARPVREQAGWRHLEVERRLLDLGGRELRQRVMELRFSGLKTEPVFAAALRIEGDPYRALLALQKLRDDELADVLAQVRRDCG